VVLEDLHWADAETHSALAYLADQLANTPTLCVATGRTDEPTPGAEMLARLARTHPRRTLTLGRLSGADVAAIAAQMLDREPASALLDALVARSQGVPLLVEELLAEALEHPNRDLDRLPLPATYHAVVQRRVSLLDERAGRVVTVAAVVGPDAPTRLLAAISGLDAEDVRTGLRAGIAANLLYDTVSDGLAFRHALVGESILADLLPDERASIVLQAADAIEVEFPGLPGEWCELVAELRERGGDTDGAFPVLVEAGRRAFRRGALLTAEQTLDRAGQLADGDRWRQMGVNRVLARVLARTGNVNRLRQLASSTVEIMGSKLDTMGSPGRLGELHLQIARGLMAAGDWSRADEQLATVESLFAAAGDDRLLSLAQALRATAAYEVGDIDRATGLASTAEENLRRSDVNPEAACALHRAKARLALAAGDVAGASSLLQIADRLAANDTSLVFDRVETLVALAELDEATTAGMDHVVAAATAAAATEAPLTEVRVEIQRARLHLVRSELEPARTAAHRACEVSRRYDLPTLAMALMTAAEIAALQGSVREAAGFLDEAWSTSGSTSAISRAQSAVETTVALRTGDFRRARGTLEAMEQAPPHHSDVYTWFRGLHALLAALHGADSAPAAEVSHPPVTTEGALRLLAAAVTTAVVEPPTASTAILRADSFLAPFGWRRHIARLLIADVAASIDIEALPTWMQESAAYFEDAGQARLAAACRGVLGRAGVPVPRKGRGSATVPPGLQGAGVTSREMDVLLLLSDGLSNKDIAERLHVSVRTIESHVSSAMRKTATPNRAALSALVVRSQTGPSPGGPPG
jgi:DNA-binding CsgD family transcriptional regulator/tetratricopeptide (TPR) repeat protein